MPDITDEDEITAPPRCAGCGGALEPETVAGRPSLFCPSCSTTTFTGATQPAARPAARAVVSTEVAICPKCNGLLDREVVGGRDVLYCSVCDTMWDAPGSEPRRRRRSPVPMPDRRDLD